MSTETTTQSWLDLAKQEYAEAQAAKVASDEKWASGIAEHINTRLAELGIVPFNPATTDGQGHVVPAILLCAAPDEGLYEVHAAFDEETEGVALFGAAHDAPELRDLNLLISHCNPIEARRRILLAHREGPAPLPPEPEPLSPDAAAIVDALNGIHGILQSIYSYGVGQV